MLRRLAVGMAAILVALSLMAACHAGPGEQRAPTIGVVALGPRRLMVSREPGHVCMATVATVDTPTTASLACLPADFGFTDSVVSATLGPLDAGADLVALLTQPGVAIDGLGPDRVRLVVRSDTGVEALALWLDAAATGTREVCATYAGPNGGTSTVVVQRPVEVGDREVAEAAVTDGCG